MPENQNTKKPLIDFIPAEYRTGKRNYVNYYVVNPNNGKLARKTIKLNRIKNVSERKKYAKKLVVELNQKLYSGWNPFLEQEAPKSFTKLSVVLNTYLEIKTRELRKDSIRTYKSYISILIEWLLETRKENMYVVNFNNVVTAEFLNYVYMSRKVSTGKYNSYVAFFRGVWVFLIENSYSKSNPFKAIKKKKEQPKQRKPIPYEVRKQIQVYLEKEDYEFLVCTMLVYYTLLRPKELLMLKPEHIDIQKATITIPAYVAKNGKERIATISKTLKPYLKTVLENVHNSKFYIFSKKLKPGNVLLDSRTLTRKWTKLRVKLKFEIEYQLYSLRDTGIIDLIHSGLPLDQVAAQADHSSLEITSIYALHANKKANNDIVQTSAIDNVFLDIFILS